MPSEPSAPPTAATTPPTTTPLTTPPTTMSAVEVYWRTIALPTARAAFTEMNTFVDSLTPAGKQICLAKDDEPPSMLMECVGFDVFGEDLDDFQLIWMRLQTAVVMIKEMNKTKKPKYDGPATLLNAARFWLSDTMEVARDTSNAFHSAISPKRIAFSSLVKDVASHQTKRIKRFPTLADWEIRREDIVHEERVRHPTPPTSPQKEFVGPGEFEYNNKFLRIHHGFVHLRTTPSSTSVCV